MYTFSGEEQRIIKAKPWIYNQEDPVLAVQALLTDLGHPGHTRNTGASYQKLFTLLLKVAISREKEETKIIGDFLDDIARGGRPRVYELKEAISNPYSRLGNEELASAVAVVQQFLEDKITKERAVRTLDSLCA